MAPSNPKILVLENPMAIVVNVSELLSLANELNIDQQFSNAIINATEALAIEIANKEGVEHSDTSDGGEGLYSTFTPGHDGKTSDALAAKDPEGEW